MPAPEPLTPAQQAAVRQAVDEALRERHLQAAPGSIPAPEQSAPAPAPSGPTGTSGQAVPAPSDPPLESVWQSGVYTQSPEKDFVYHIGGTVHYDGAWFSASDRVQFGSRGTGALDDGFNLRRGRFRAEGTFYKYVDFLFELEFANGFNSTQQPGPGNSFLTPGPTDANFTIKSIPLIGNVRIGSQKEPFSLEHLNSYRYLEFMERSYLFDFAQPTAFNNGFSPGVSAFNTLFDDRATWAVGFFKNERDLYGFGLGDGQYAFTGRGTVLALYEDDGRQMVHFGVGGSHRDPVDGQVQIRIRPSVRNAPFPLLPLIANTGQIGSTTQDLVNFETAAVFGPLTFQAEYTSTYIHNATQAAIGNVGTAFFQGYYVEALCFLTGEHRPWNKKAAIFNRVVPRTPINFDGGCVNGLGAWEVGVRYTSLDLNNRGINGGALANVTVGLNWYLTGNAKLQWNYDYGRRYATGGSADGNIHAFGMRAAFDF